MLGDKKRLLHSIFDSASILRLASFFLSGAMTLSFTDLPAELRLRIYDYCLHPERARRESPLYYPTNISWTGYENSCWYVQKNEPHDVSKGICKCSSGEPWIPFLQRQGHLNPQILRLSRRCYDESVSRLYEHRTFRPLNFRSFGSRIDYVLERVWILNSFLSRISEKARLAIKSVQLPMNPSGKPAELKRCKDAFATIKSKLPDLQRIVLELNIDGESLSSFVRFLGLQPQDDELRELSAARTFKFKLYPALTFSHVEIVVDIIVYGDAPKIRDLKNKMELQLASTEAERQLSAMLEKHNARQAARQRSEWNAEEEDYSQNMLHDDMVPA